MSYTNGLDKPSDYFNTVLYTGNGGTNNITGVEFQPDWVWIKTRSEESNHMLFDIIRGTGKELHSQNTEAEITSATTLTSFDSDGFTLGNNGNLNRNTETYASWNWLASNTTASNTDGSITSTVSANTTSGFSIVSFTGDGNTSTVGHGLGVAPKFFIVKNRSASGSWFTYTTVIDGSLDFLNLNDTSAKSDSGLSLPTTSVFSVNSSTAPNTNNIIAYCFAEKKGFSKFSSYTGNGSTDGTFVYTGFKPAWVMVKRTTNFGGWVIYDNKRDSYNVTDLFLYADTSDADVPFTGYDFLSNGFKARTTGGAMNSSGDTFIYMAFAENPFVISTGIPTTAR